MADSPKKSKKEIDASISKTLAEADKIQAEAEKVRLEQAKIALEVERLKIDNQDINEYMNFIINRLFASNKYFYSNDNVDIFLNSVNWLAEDYELISIRPKLVPYREFVVNSLEKEFVKWSSWVFPPLIMILMASIVWWRRR